MAKYKIINYFDVYCDEEGWHVNNLCEEKREVVLSDNPNATEVLSALIEVGFISHDVTLDMIAIYVNDLEVIELFDSTFENEMPIGMLELVK